MLRKMLRGAAAGAVGTAVLNITTYGDMAVRGRPASKMPQKAAKKLAETTHVRLRAAGEAGDKKENRTQGIGALLGYVAGIGVGVGYAFVREAMPRKTVPFAPLAVGAAAMVAGDLPIVALRLSNPKDWDKEAWLSDILPHLAYGLATVAAYETMRGPGEVEEVRLREEIVLRP